MSYKQAVQDGVRCEKDGYGIIKYFPCCHRCGRESFSISYLPGHKYTCRVCKMIRANEIERNKKRAKMRR